MTKAQFYWFVIHIRKKFVSFRSEIFNFLRWDISDDFETPCYHIMQPSHIFSHCSEIHLSFLLILALNGIDATTNHQIWQICIGGKKNMTRMLWSWKFALLIFATIKFAHSLIGNDTQKATSSFQDFCMMPSCKIHCLILYANLCIFESN